jgi:Zinc finger, C3HC4 type (RING finger)
VTYEYFTFKKSNYDKEKKLNVKKMQTKIEIGFFSWVLKAVYGVDEDSDNKTINIKSFKNECIMCYDEDTDVMIYPCRHLSIGFKCAQNLRNSKKCRECPVCRATIERFIKINI